MTLSIGLLRAVNLAGRNTVSMADLRDLLAELGLTDGRTLLQSGNLVFRCNARTSGQVERLLEEAAQKRLGLETDFFVRSGAEWKAIIDGNPFPEEARRDPSRLLVHFLKKSPNRERVTSLQNAIKGRETFRIKGRHAYIVYPDGIGRSRVTAALIEKSLGTRCTGRNWNTVLKLSAFA